MDKINKIIAMIRGHHIIKYEIISGTIESNDFELLLKFNGILKKLKLWQSTNLQTSLII